LGIANINYLITKTSYPNKEVKCTEPSLQLALPGETLRLAGASTVEIGRKNWSTMTKKREKRIEIDRK
jgi:hypothetical protein